MEGGSFTPDQVIRWLKDMGVAAHATSFRGGRIIKSMDEEIPPIIRPRRLRLNPLMRQMLQRVQVRRSDLIVPVFVREGKGVRQEVASMPGVFQMSVDVALPWLAKLGEQGVSGRIWCSA